MAISCKGQIRVDKGHRCYWSFMHPHSKFPRYCYYQYCMVYNIHMGGRKASRILSNNRAIVLHQGGQCRWAGGMKGWLIRARQPRSRKVGSKPETWDGMCLRHAGLEKRHEHYLTPTVSGFQGRDRPSYQCPSRFVGR